MKKIIKETDEKRGIVQVTIADERWYIKEITNQITGIPEFKFVPSNTWITGCYPKGIQFYKWLAEKGWDEAEAVKIAAGEKGTKVHLAIEAIMRGEEVRIDSKFLNPTTGVEEELSLEECDAILSFISWRTEMEKSHLIETIANETVVWSDKHNAAGTIDWIVKFTDKETGEIQFWIIDFKTSQHIWKSHELQVSFYRETITNAENHFQGLDASNLKSAILQLGYRKNKAGYKFTEIENKFKLWIVAQNIWAEEHGDEQPNKKDYPIVLSPAITVDEVLEANEEISQKSPIKSKPKVSKII